MNFIIFTFKLSKITLKIATLITFPSKNLLRLFYWEEKKEIKFLSVMDKKLKVKRQRIFEIEKRLNYEIGRVEEF